MFLCKLYNFVLFQLDMMQCATDIQFYCFMRSVTDLKKGQIYKVFDMLDVDRSGLLDFDEFYLLICILVAIRVRPSLFMCIIYVCLYVWLCVFTCTVYKITIRPV